MSVVDGADELESEAGSGACYLENGKLPDPAARDAARRSQSTSRGSRAISNTYVTGQVLTVDGGLTVTF